jgi:hypothetical protein
MKKILASVLFLNALLAVDVFAQINENIDPGKFPIDVSTKRISFVEVVVVPATDALEMFHRGLKWFNTYYKNPADVIRETDSLRNKIVGKARFKIYKPSDRKDVKMEGGNVEYTITLNLKADKFRYTITDLNWKQSSYFPVERWLDTTAQTYVKAYYPSYLEQMDKQVHEIISNLEAFMKTMPAKKNDDW